MFKKRVRQSNLSKILLGGGITIPKEIRQTLEPSQELNCFLDSYIGKLKGKIFTFYSLSCIVNKEKTARDCIQRTGLGSLIIYEEKLKINKQGIIYLPNDLLHILELNPSSKAKISGIFDDCFTIMSQENNKLALEYITQEDYIVEW